MAHDPEQRSDEGTPSPPQEMVSFGKYQLFDLVGKGGMAEVYLARPGAQRRLVAIKCIRSQLAGEKQYVEMFVREGNLAMKLNHETIVKTYELGRVRGRHFISMEYIAGVDLTTILRRCQAGSAHRLPVPHALYIAQRICEGLHYAHELCDSGGRPLGLVNRDVSPSNVRLSFEGEVKLLDFGIAKAKSSLTSEIGVVKGKYSHMSPEQVRGLPLDRRSDIFAAGILLHEMLTLEKLFRGDSDFAIMDLVRRAEVLPPSQINPRISDEVDRLVLRALQRDASDRFQTAEEMAAELRGVLATYNFSKGELRDLVRELCRDEWQESQRLTEAALSGEGQAPLLAGDLEEDYGEFIEILEDEPEEEEPAVQPEEEEAPRGQPRWIYGLLVFAVLLLAFALLLTARLVLS